MTRFKQFEPTSSRLLMKVSEFRVSPTKNQLKVRIINRGLNAVTENFFDRVDSDYRQPAPTR